MNLANITVVAVAAADALILLGVLGAHLHGWHTLNRRDTEARQRYWSTQYGQNPPPLP